MEYKVCNIVYVENTDVTKYRRYRVKTKYNLKLILTGIETSTYFISLLYDINVVIKLEIVRQRNF